MKAVAVGSRTESEWQAEDDMRTILRAKEIQKDTKRMAAVKKCAKKKMDAMKSIAEPATK